MLYLLHGTNQDEARRKGNELLESLQKKKPDAAVFKLDAEKWSAAFFEELIGGQGLFERKYIVYVGGVFENKDIKEAWVLYQKALAADISPEEVHGILFWQVKNIAVVQEARDSKESGLSPFVFMKAKQFASRFKEGEIETKATELVSLFHEGRRGGSELDIALERFILSI